MTDGATTSMQPRRLQTHVRLLDAAEQLFGSRGIEQTAVSEVAVLADRSIGSLYDHFTDKAGLVQALVDRVLTRIETAAVSVVRPGRWDDGRAIDIIAAYVSGSLAMNRDNPGFRRIMYEVSLVDTKVRDRFRAVRSTLYRALVEALLDHRDEIGHPAPELAVPFTVDTLTALLTSRIDPVMNPTETENLDDEAFLAACLDLASAHLRLTSPSAAREQP